MVPTAAVMETAEAFARKIAENGPLAVQKIKEKWLTQICASAVDTHFFVGTVLKHGTWVILGAFWPKKPPIYP